MASTGLLSRLSRLERRRGDGDGEQRVVFVLLPPGEPIPEGERPFTLKIGEMRRDEDGEPT